MQRRQSHPHAQLTGLIVVISLMLSVGIMFWVPSVGPAPSLDPASAHAASTPTLPILGVTRTPRPDPNAPVAQEGEPPVPTMDWSTVPTPVPADQMVAEALAQTAAAVPPPAQVVYVDRTVYVAAETAPAAEALAPLETVQCPCGPSAEEEQAAHDYNQRRLDSGAYRPRTR